MSKSACFHQNVLLLTQLIKPSDEFKKHFRKGMFDKPNTIGFLHVSHYLLTIYDAERFDKLVEWPVICKTTEVAYRNSVKEYLIQISVENPAIGFPNILPSHLYHAGGTKFTIIMWKLSQTVLRKYIVREINPDIMLLPQAGSQINLTRSILEGMHAKVNCNIANEHRSLSEMENKAKFALDTDKEESNKIITEIFETEKSIENLSQSAPVHSAFRSSLRNINDEEVIKMWKTNINKSINWIQKRNAALKNIEQRASEIDKIILDNSGYTETKGVKLININNLENSELFCPDMQCLLFHLYKNDKLVLKYFLLVFKYLLLRLHQQLQLRTPEDLSECLLQLQASCKDLKDALDVLITYEVDVNKMISKIKSSACERDTMQIHDDDVLPIMNNIRIMYASPVIKIDTNHSDEEGSDLQKLLQLTPVEAAHKPLFSRYERLKQKRVLHGSKFRENFISRINLDDTVTSTRSEKQYSHVPAIQCKKNVLSFKGAEKYSRLFSTRVPRYNNPANLSVMSMPCTSKANSTTLANTIEEVHNISEMSINISMKSFCNLSIQVTPKKKLLTVEQCKSEDISEMDVVSDNPNKVDVLDICGTLHVEIQKDQDDNFEQTKRRRSIGDLVERYKKLLNGNCSSPNLSGKE